MIRQTVYIIAILATSMSIGCGKDAAKDGKDNKATAEYEAAIAKLDDKTNVCCSSEIEIGGQKTTVVGTSFKSACLEAKGKILLDQTYPDCHK